MSRGGLRTKQKARPDSVRKALRMEYVLGKRVAGYSYPEIAREAQALPAEERERLSISRAYDQRKVHADVVEALANVREHLAESVAELREIEYQRLQTLLKRLMEAAVAGNMEAIQTALSAHDRVVKLHGLATQEKPMDPESVPVLVVRAGG